MKGKNTKKGGEGILLGQSTIQQQSSLLPTLQKTTEKEKTNGMKLLNPNISTREDKGRALHQIVAKV